MFYRVGLCKACSCWCVQLIRRTNERRRKKSEQARRFLGPMLVAPAPPAIANKHDNLLTVPKQAQLVTTSAPLPLCATSVTSPTTSSQPQASSLARCVCLYLPRFGQCFETDCNKPSKKSAVCIPQPNSHATRTPFSRGALYGTVADSVLRAVRRILLQDIR